MKSRQKQTGVTMIELLIVLTIAAILAAIAAPSFTSLINSTRQNSAMSQLVADLNRARGEAIKRNVRVLICIRNSSGTDCGTGTDWQNGWLICHDEDQDNACDTTSATNPNPIAVHQALTSQLTLTGPNVIRFNASGTQGAGGAATLTLNGTWTNAQAKVASIAATGNISRP